jgi:hypothetical protein
MLQIINGGTLTPRNSSGFAGVSDLIDQLYGDAQVKQKLKAGEKKPMTSQELFMNAMRDILPNRSKGEISGLEQAVKDLQADNERLKVKKNAD